MPSGAETGVGRRAEHDQPLLSVDGITKHFAVRRGLKRRPEVVRAVDGVSFDVSEGETLGLVGESGCGKSTLARVLTGLYRPTLGTIRVRGVDIHARSGGEHLQGVVQMVFQDPASSLDPRRRIADSVGEPLLKSVKRVERIQRVNEHLGRVELARGMGDRYPHQLSGGQQQRACIARALISEPSLVVLDEALSSLDVSLQAQIVRLLRDLQAEFGISYVFITHDLATAFELSARIAIMYLGEIVELLPVAAFQQGTLHPYSRALIEAILVPDPDAQRDRTLPLLEGDIPSAARPPNGCRFHTRCPHAQERCTRESPLLIAHRQDHWAACHFAPNLYPEQSSTPVGRGQP